MESLIFVALCLVTIVAVLALLALMMAIKALGDNHKEVAAMTEHAVQSLSMVKGLDPHHAAPKVYSPGPVGASWAAVEEQHVKVVDQALEMRKRDRRRVLEDARIYHERQGNMDRVKQIDRDLEAVEATS